MSFKMFPDKLVGDNRTFIAQDVREVLNRAGIQVVDDKFKGLEGIPPSEFILWHSCSSAGRATYKIQVSRREEVLGRWVVGDKLAMLPNKPCR